FFGIAFLIPSTVIVSKSIQINASQIQVAGQIENFKNWNNWYPSFSNKSVSVTALDIQKDSIYSSVQLSDSMGRDIIFTLLPSSGNTLKINLKTNKNKTINYQFILFPGGEGHTLLVWNINTYLGWYPWQRLRGLIMDKITGPAYISALENLKKAVENHLGSSSDK
ncbi:MAG: SRPBCC family protein, partial [Ginsengibacter sp.]